MTINELRLASRLQAAVKNITQASAILASVKQDAQRYLSDAAVTIDLVSISEQLNGLNEDASFALGTLEVLASRQQPA
jgi:hypothetical protein